MDRGAYLSEARSWSNTPPCVTDDRRDTVLIAVFTPRGRGRLPVIKGVDIKLAHGLPGKPAEGHTL